MTATWADFEAAAPELARATSERLEAAGLALLGTLRRDGSPRISPVEPHIVGERIVIAAMPWSMKARDLSRDPRCVLHSAVSDVEGSDGEFKLYGRAHEVEDEEARRAANAWWSSRPREVARLFSLAIGAAVAVRWDIAAGEVTIERWSPGRPPSSVTRRYP